MKRQLMTLAAVGLVLTAANPAYARYPHAVGSGATPPRCMKWPAALAADGCLGADPTGVWKFTNTGTGDQGIPLGLGMTLQQRMDQTQPGWSISHPHYFNRPGEDDYPLGPSAATLAATFKDPAGAVPDPCVSYIHGPGGSGNNNPNGDQLTINCSGKDIVLDGYYFGEGFGHLCPEIRSLAFKSLTIKNYFIKNGDSCPATLYSSLAQLASGNTYFGQGVVDGKWQGYKAQNTTTITAGVAKVISIASAPKNIVLFSPGGTDYKLGDNTLSTCSDTDKTGGPSGSGFRIVIPVGTATNICFYNPTAGGTVYAPGTDSPNPGFRAFGFGDVGTSSAPCSITIHQTVFLNMPADLGGNNLAYCNWLNEFNYADGINESGSDHSAWFATTTYLGTQGSATYANQSIINHYRYAHNVSRVGPENIPGTGSTTFSLLMQEPWVHVLNAEIDGNSVAINTPNGSTVPGVTGSSFNAGFFYASDGLIDNLEVKDNEISIPGAADCYTTDSVITPDSMGNGGVVGTISGTTLTVTATPTLNGAVSGKANLWPNEYVAYTTPFYIVQQLTSTEPDGRPGGMGTYQISTSMTATLSGVKAYNTGIMNLTQSGNITLTDGSNFVFVPSSQNWYGHAFTNSPVEACHSASNPAG